MAFPTETVYGLGCNGLDIKAVNNIFKAKKRPLNDPIILHVLSYQEMVKLVDITEISNESLNLCWKLTQQFWPGPMTLVLPKCEIVPDCITSNSSFVAVRAPKHPLTI